MQSQAIPNPLSHSICLQMPKRELSSAWMEHVPFAMYLIDIVRPKLFVELGTFYGISYCAFCQAIKELSLASNCYAVDTWEGDLHTGSYAADVLMDLRQHHDPLYGGFSTLVQSTFDKAVDSFADRSIDLLHIDGLHTYEAVKHDFETWLPKMSESGVILFHDTNEHRDNFGVWRLWEELKGRYPSFEFLHGHGLGMIAVGNIVSNELQQIFDTTGRDREVLQKFFYELGQRVVLKTELMEKRHDEGVLRDELARSAEIIRSTEGSVIIPIGGLVRASRKIVRLWRREGLKFVLLAILERLNSTFLSRAILRFWPYQIRPKKNRQADRQEIPGFAYQPLISILMPVYNTPVRYLRAAVESVQKQLYSNWELCICDDASTNPNTLKELKSLEQNDRIRIVYSQNNLGISSTTNKAASIAYGDLLAFMDHDDELAVDALLEMVKAWNESPTMDVFYSDQNKINFWGRLSEPFYKPDWSPEYFNSVMYIGHLLVVRRSLFEQIKGFNPQYDGVQDFEFMLRVSEHTERIGHIPRILYHWRRIPGSVAFGMDEKGDKIEELQVKAVSEHLSRQGLPAVATRNPNFKHRAAIQPKLRSEYPLISIIIPTRNAPLYISRCLESIFKRTTYPRFEVIVVDNNTTHLSALKSLQTYPITTIRFDQPFNYSHANNLGVREANGEYVVLLNNDTEVITPDWLERMLYYAEMPDVGATGPLLLYPNKTVQHAGIVLGFRGTADHVMRGYPYNSDGYAGSLSSPREVSAVTGACMMLKRSTYLEIGGMEEHYSIHYQDVDLCLRLRALEKRIIYTPYALIVHYEGITRGLSYDFLDRALLLDTWGEVIERGDPFYSPNFSLKVPYLPL